MSDTGITLANPGSNRDAVIDQYIKERNAPPVVENAPAPSEAPEVTEAAPEAQFEEPAVETPVEPDLVADDAGDDGQHEEVATEEAGDQIVTIYPNGPDGEPVEATLSELQSSYMRQSDYTKKTQEVAEQRRQADAMAQEISAQREHYMRSIEAIGNALHADAPPPPDPSIQDVDPVLYLQQVNAVNEHEKQMSNLQAEHHQAQMQQQHAMVQHQEAVLVESRAQLTNALPYLKDPEKMQEFVTKNRAYVQDVLGYTKEQADNIYDYRAAIVIDKARRADEQRSKAQVKIKQAPRNTGTPTIRQSQTAGRPPAAQSEVKKAETALNKVGNVENAVQYMKARRAARQTR